MTSTGVPSLDDLLGGGMWLSSSLLVLAPDHITAYGDLVQRYFIAQGLASGQNVCVVGDDAKRWVQECMWKAAGEEEEGEEGDGDVKVKIAWRYKEMKRIQTTMGSIDQDYCGTFDLGRRIPETVVDEAIRSGQLSCVDVSSSTVEGVFERVEECLVREDQRVMRVCVPSLGGAEWGEMGGEEIVGFMHGLRRLLRQQGHGCGSVSVPSYMCTEGTWREKMGWFCDGMVIIESEVENEGSYDGIIRVVGVKGSARSRLLGSEEQSGENNVGFRVVRKRLIIERVALE